ncbi:MAG: glycosyltransferase family 4 protein [Prolixibacteraceae bacterium]|nr:glycosyltransferase family 4 protein [Prolixibacteraceae bacterium]
MPIIHITQHFWPMRGGQELLIHKMCKVASSLGMRTLIIQPFQFSLLKRSTYTQGNFPENTILLPIPTFYNLFILAKKTINIFKIDFSTETSNYIPWVSFNFSLKLFSCFFKLFNFKKMVIIHYHFHQPSFNLSNSFIFSHGVIWERPPKTKLDHIRMNTLELVIKNKNVKGVIANDHDYIREIEKVSSEKVIMNKKLIFLPNPVDLSMFYFDRSVSNNSLDFKRIILIRNIRNDRGIYEAIKSFLIFLNNEEFLDWTLDIFGLYEEKDSYYLMCKNLIPKSLENQIKFKGTVNNSEVADIYRKSSLSLVPSQSLEGTSLSALESMACGTPCISTPIGGLLDLPTYKSKSISCDDIAIAIKELILNFYEIRQKQIEGVKKFSLENWTENFGNILKDNY